MTHKEIEELVNNYPTKNKEGFTPKEMNTLISDLGLDEHKFYTALGVNTCMMIGGEVITYHCDVELGVICTLENRDKRVEEWD